jgi:uncharacterized protein YchJ
MNIKLIFLLAACAGGDGNGGAAPAKDATALFPAVLATSNARWVANNDYRIPRRFVQGVKWGYIDASGKTRIPPSYSEAGRFHDGLAAVQIGGKFGYIDTSGTLLIPAKYSFAKAFSEQRAAVCIETKRWLIVKERWGFIDTKGAVIVEPKYTDVLDYSEGLAGIIAGGPYDEQSGFVDRAGNFVIKPQFYNIRAFSSGLALIHDRKGYNGRFIRRDGSIAFTEAPFSELRDFRDGLAVFRETGKAGFLDTHGEVAIKPIFDAADSMHEGLAAVRIGEMWGFIDKNGKTVIKSEFMGNDDVDWVELSRRDGFRMALGVPPFFSGGYAFVKTKSGWIGFVDHRGQRVAAAVKGRGYGEFNNGLAEFRQLKSIDKRHDSIEYGYMKPSGEVVFSTTFGVETPP